MTTTPSILSTLRRLAGSRLRALICCLLVLVATYDSYVYALCGATGPFLVSQTSSPFPDDDDDDEMLDLTGPAARAQALPREARLPSPTSAWWIALEEPRPPISTHRQIAPATRAGEQARRNGIGAPLLC
jgi:hypothetical protein